MRRVLLDVEPTQCHPCGASFAGPKAFDAHRSGPVQRRVCVPPAHLGMVQLASRPGVWGIPIPPVARDPLTQPSLLDARPKTQKGRPSSGAPEEVNRLPLAG